MTQIYDEFRAQMKERMNELGLSQTLLVKQLVPSGLGFYQTTVSRILNGRQEPRLTEAVIIARALKMDLGALVAGTGCETCHGAPPAGFVCATCGRRGGSDG